MVQDVNEQREVERRLVVSAIQTLRESGTEINPHTVAQTAQIPRSTIYRNAELMDLIAQAEDANRSSDRIAELENRIQQLDQTIWDLEKQNEELQMEAQNVWTQGFTAGLEEAARRHADPQSEPLSAAAAREKARNMPTQEFIRPKVETITAEPPVYSNQLETSAHVPPLNHEQLAESLLEAKVDRVLAAATQQLQQSQAKEQAAPAAPQAEAPEKAVAQNQGHTAAKQDQATVFTISPAPVPTWQATSIRSSSCLGRIWKPSTTSGLNH